LKKAIEMIKFFLVLSLALTLPLASLAQSQKFDPKNPPAPGAGIDPGIMAGSELSRSGDKYSDQKKFWGDDTISKAFDNASTNTGGFLANMWTQYGPKLASEALWQENLRAAVQAAKAGDWAKAEHECEQCIANNPNAVDAKLLRAVVLQKLNRLNQNPKAELDVKTLMGTRQHAADFLNGNATKTPVADTVLRQTLQSQSGTVPGKVHSFGDLQQEIRSKAK